MLDQVLEVFNIKPNFDLDIMRERQTITSITTRCLEGLDNIIKQLKPDLVLVHGDTSTTFAGALSAFYNKVPVGHVEAGLRTYDKYSPFPEEMNRVLTSKIADLHFAPTKTNKNNLLKEGITQGIYVTGNTVIDALKHTVVPEYKFTCDKLADFDFSERKVVLVTAHRRENLGRPLENICAAIKKLIHIYEDIFIVWPVHLNPVVRETVFSILGSIERVSLIEPLDVLDMHNLLARSFIIMTDSGGLQEEAPSLGKPVLVLRTETERPEVVEAGAVKLVGVEEESIFEAASLLLTNRTEYEHMARATNPYGDGNASSRIVNAILRYFGY